MNDFKYRLAQLRDLPQIMQIIAQAQQSLKELGIDQWQNGYPSESIIKNDIEKGHAYIVFEKEHVVATFALVFNYEPTYDRIYEGEWLSADEFVVVHRIAVSNVYKKKGIALGILTYVENLAREKNIYSFKIDTHEGNIPMQKTLIRKGFTYCGIIYLTDGNKRLAYEKRLI